MNAVSRCVGDIPHFHPVFAVGDYIAQFDIPKAEAWVSVIRKHNLDRLSPRDQISYMNQFWHHRLGLMSTNTIAEREALIDFVPPEEWLSIFKNDVVPCIVEHWDGR